MAAAKRPVGAARVLQCRSTLVDGPPSKARQFDALLQTLAHAGPPRAIPSPRATIPLTPRTGPDATGPRDPAGPTSDPAVKQHPAPAMRRGQIDPHLVRMLHVWPSLPTRIREAIVAMIDAAGQNRTVADPRPTQ